MATTLRLLAAPTLASLLLLAPRASAQDAPLAESGTDDAEAGAVPRDVVEAEDTDEREDTTDVVEAPPPADAPLFAVGSRASSSAPFTLSGWVEAFYAWNFNEPSNAITAARAFDNRHNSFELANVVLDLHWDYENVVGRIALQYGTTPTTYYLAEPLGLASGSGVGPSAAALWQMLQEAHVGYRLPIGNGLVVEAGLFLSPIGPEGLAVHENYLFSRWNLFYGFPFYHTGIRATYAIDDTFAIAVWGMNGWNTILDNNDEKSFAVQLTINPGDWLSASVTYLSGVERDRTAAERQVMPGDDVPWRHLFDANATITPVDWLGLRMQLTGGFEPSHLGLASWLGGGLQVRVAPLEWLAVAARGDFFWEDVPAGGAAVFWSGSEWVSSTTIGVDLHPEDHVSLRIEYRHDESAAPLYFRGAVMGNGTPATPFLANSTAQDTLTIGTTAWF